MARTRRFHLDLPPVTATVAGRQVSFVGATFHSRCVMIEYGVEPPMDRAQHPFGPNLLVLIATDDDDTGAYPTSWEDFNWSFQQPGRMTTRLDRRPGPNATRLIVSVRELTIVATPDSGIRHIPSDHEVAALEIHLPEGHATGPSRETGQEL